MLEIAARRTPASRTVARPMACSPTRCQAVSADPGWLPIICPVCHTIAHALPAGPDEMSVACTCCNLYRLTHAGERILTTTPDPIDRTDLSRTLRDARAMVGEEWPLIDSLSARTLIALSAKRAALSGPTARSQAAPWMQYDRAPSGQAVRA